ncbi:hypothetical protein HanXRQr2_Chr15g0715871 [Helianthus annuus]|uniref:Uncharacterized protein n=1 Tax=Helianthus annuus TaxID=4232 RepID=A0A9K3H561_HELAN|nr:hypothetical protein HanXRQr2_Chr15g0715871 [Helianthus annuus]KAJ0833150.1 hypothetical protein HanPSC8_Chr15g0686951 [Helianthus annuus]
MYYTFHHHANKKIILHFQICYSKRSTISLSLTQTHAHTHSLSLSLSTSN